MSEPDSNPIVDRILTPIAASRPGAWFYVHVAPPIDRFLLRLTGGTWTTGGRHRVGFLKVKGAKSGLERITPLLFTRDGGKLLLVASRGGDVKHPAWYRNLIANPRVTFSIDSEAGDYQARELEGAERDRAWELVVRRYAGYAVYQRRAGGRKIPVISLEPPE